MKINKKHITHILLVSILTGLIGGLAINRAVFIHTHKMVDGRVVVHAHPFDRTQGNSEPPTHLHSQAGFLALDNLEVFILTIFLSGLMVLLLFERTLFRKDIQLVTKASYPFYDGRAPPYKW